MFNIEEFKKSFKDEINQLQENVDYGIIWREGKFKTYILYSEELRQKYWGESDEGYDYKVEVKEPDDSFSRAYKSSVYQKNGGQSSASYNPDYRILRPSHSSSSTANRNFNQEFGITRITSLDGSSVPENFAFFHRYNDEGEMIEERKVYLNEGEVANFWGYERTDSTRIEEINNCENETIMFGELSEWTVLEKGFIRSKGKGTVINREGKEINSVLLAGGFFGFDEEYEKIKRNIIERIKKGVGEWKVYNEKGRIWNKKILVHHSFDSKISIESDCCKNPVIMDKEDCGKVHWESGFTEAQWREIMEVPNLIKSEQQLAQIKILPPQRFQ